jgi:hypothetical protein
VGFNIKTGCCPLLSTNILKDPLRYLLCIRRSVQGTDYLFIHLLLNILYKASSIDAYVCTSGNVSWGTNKSEYPAGTVIINQVADLFFLRIE